MEPAKSSPSINSEKTLSEYSEIDSLRVSVLSEALPYIQRFSGKKIVIKYGGAAMVDKDLQKAVLRDIALLSTVGVQPIVVHGGGPEINHWLKKLKIKPNFQDGLRVTDSQTMEVVEMVLAGRVNKKIVNGINELGALSIGLCGIDGKLIEAEIFNNGSHGLVGKVTKINVDVLEPILTKGYVPVISSIAGSIEGKSLNINADTIAGELAATLGAVKLILLTDTSGILKDRNDPTTLISKINQDEVLKLIQQGIIEGGMVPKTECCINALQKGVTAAHILDGRIPHALLLEVFTDLGIGTMVTKNSNNK